MSYDKIPGRCNSCRYYDREDLGDVNYAYCRRHPPIAIKEHENGLPRGVWPVVGYDDFCAEYKSEEE